MSWSNICSRSPFPAAIPRPLAKQLIARFGSFGALLSADWRDLAQIKELSETSIAALKIAQASALRLLKSEIVERPLLSGWQAVLDYLRADMAHLPVERVRVPPSECPQHAAAATTIWATDRSTRRPSTRARW